MDRKGIMEESIQIIASDGFARELYKNPAIHSISSVSVVSRPSFPALLILQVMLSFCPRNCVIFQKGHLRVKMHTLPEASVVSLSLSFK